MSSRSCTSAGQSSYDANFIVNEEMIYQLGNVAEILFYLLGAMAIVTLIDVHHGFTGITRRIRTHSKKKAAVVDCIPHV